MLKPLREYFDNSGKLIQNLSAFTATLPFYSLGVHIDNWLKYWYGDEKARDDDYLVYINSWLASSTDRLSKLYNALAENYDPLENYRMTEESGKATKRAEMDIDTSRTGTFKTTTKPAGVTSTEKRTTDDGLTMRDYAQNVTNYDVNGTVTEVTEEGTDHGVKTKNSYQGSETLSAGNISVSGHEVETNEITRSGNIGVTTSQQMLQSEIDIRLANDFVKLFGEIFERECLTGVFDFGYNFTL